MHAALLGLSHPHSALLLRTLDNLPEIHRISLWDPQVARLHGDLPESRKIALRANDLDDVLCQDDLVFAIVCVRTDLAGPLTHRVLAAGKHVLAEKPGALTAAQIEDLDQAAASAGLTAGVLYLRRLHPCMIAARQLAQSGELGRLLSFEARFLTTQVRFREPTSWLFRRDQAGGGILPWLGCHCLDLIRHVTGSEFSSVSALLPTLSGEAIDVEDNAALALRLDCGAIGTLNAGYTLAYSGSGYANAAGYDSYLGFAFERGRIVWPDLEPRLMVERPPREGEPPRRTESFEVPESSSYGGALGEAFLRQYIAALQGRGEPPARLSDALAVARVVEAAQRSDQGGRRESIHHRP